MYVKQYEFKTDMNTTYPIPHDRSGILVLRGTTGCTARVISGSYNRNTYPAKYTFRDPATYLCVIKIDAMPNGMAILTLAHGSSTFAVASADSIAFDMTAPSTGIAIIGLPEGGETPMLEYYAEC